MGTDSFSVLLRLCRLLKPSSKSLRSTRSSTSDWEMPKSSKLCGMVGLNPLGPGASVSAMNDSEPHLCHRPDRCVYLQAWDSYLNNFEQPQAGFTRSGRH